MTTKQLTVVIPLFDDFESASDLISLIGGLINEESVKFLLVDNGSQTDQISELVDELKYKNVSAVKCHSNLGFGGGIMFGISYVDTSHVGWMPGNLKVNPDDAINVWKQLLAHPEFGAAKAKRRRDTKVEYLKTFAAGILASIVYRRNLLDSGGTPTVVDTEFMKRLAKIAPSGYDFELFTMFAIRKSGIRLLRPVVKYRTRKYGQSHWQTSLASEINLMMKLLSQQERIKLMKQGKY
jgi:hypothetical protein